MEAIRVLIADDHPVFRYGLRSLLANDPEIKVVSEAESAAEVLADVGRVYPDVVLLDIRMPGPTGINVAQELRRSHPEIKVLVLTAYDDDEYLMDALRVGVHGYLLKNTSHETLSSAIRQVHAGQRLLAPEQVSKVLEQFEELAQEQARKQSDLSDAELEILEHLARGDTEEAIVATDWSRSVENRDMDLKLAVELVPELITQRSIGSPSLAMCYVAAGRFDAYYHFSLEVWDVAAAVCIVEEAGGIVSDLNGGPWLYSDGDYMTANSLIHKNIIRLTTDFRTRMKGLRLQV